MSEENYKIDIEVYSGPLDLLLYLIKEHEIDLYDIPIGFITEKYASHLEHLKEVNINNVGDFLVMFSTLIEIKSKMLIPREEIVMDDVEDPRTELVAALLEYKRLKEATSLLARQGALSNRRFARHPEHLLRKRKGDLDEPAEIKGQIQDLYRAFKKVLRETGGADLRTIEYDEIPTETHMLNVLDAIKAGDGKADFRALIQPGWHRAHMAGLFVSLLELIRQSKILVTQEDRHGNIFLAPGPAFDTPIYSEWNDEEEALHHDAQAAMGELDEEESSSASMAVTAEDLGGFTKENPPDRGDLPPFEINPPEDAEESPPASEHPEGDVS